MACCELENESRVAIDTTAKLVLPTRHSCQDDSIVFRLHVELVISIIQPSIFQPFDTRSKSRYAIAEEAQRRALMFLFPSGVSPPPAFNGTVDIPLLYSIIGPAPALPSRAIDKYLQPASLVPTLLPFQKRSVSWLLSRENKALSETGEIVSRTNADGAILPLHWSRISLTEDKELYYNCVLGILSETFPDDHSDQSLGGILAEEPGLGKTLECISLISLNPSIDRNPEHKSWDPVAKLHVKDIKTTLIVTPATLAPQWADEIAAHAPTLKVLIYEGWAKVPVPISESDAQAAREKRENARKRAKRSRAMKKSIAKGKRRADDSDVEMEDVEDEDEEIVDWCTYVHEFDVVITTYDVLQQDLGVARPPPIRPRRNIVQYSNVERSRSPLIMCEWYRVIMDEVQMVGGGKAQEMVSLIPRLSSFAVSGTPARNNVGDLIHVLKFLRVDEVTSSKIWNRLLLPGYVNEFTELFQKYAIRTMKAGVKDELTIPKQTRFLVPVELGRVERHVYDQTFEQALLELGLDARGVAVTENWEIDTGVLRSWLRKIRGICTHPQVGQLSNQADKLHKPGVLKTIGEVLEGMREQNWRNFMEDRRNKIQTLCNIVQLKQHDQTDADRYQRALEILLTAEKDALALIKDIETALAEHHASGEKLREEAARSRQEISTKVGESGTTTDANNAPKDNGKGKERQSSPESDLGSEDSDIPQNAAGEEYEIKRRAIQQRLRECQITLHKVYFLKGDIYHVLGNAYSDQETEAYAVAEDLRRVLLKSTEAAAKRAMAQLVTDASTKGIAEKDLYIKSPFLEKGGIRTWELNEEGNEMIDLILNAQSSLMWEWRTRMIALLTQPLSASDDEVDGQEYNRSLDTQGEAEAYLQAYASLLADRREALTSERTLLAAHEGREIKTRKTKAAARAEEDNFEGIDQLDIEALPENQVLQKELADARKAILEEYESTAAPIGTKRALRSVMVDLNNVAAKIGKENDPERIIARAAASSLRELINSQAKLIDRLQNDFALFRKAFNDRISYFRQLQELSDTVMEAEWEGDLVDALQRMQDTSEELTVKINTGRARHRYMEHLTKVQGDGGAAEDDDCCILCKCEFTRGYLTQCAHVFCEGCMKAWLSRKEGKACPVCRVVINPDQLQRFSVTGPAAVPAQVRPTKLGNNEPAPKSRRVVRYNTIDNDLFESIQMMECHGNYGSKIQTLVRHLLYLQISDPNSKSIVFSAWADSLHIIQHALSLNGIICLRVDQNTAKKNAAKRFRVDPTISVLLLHGERENAGLNVTCASRVILLESVVNHAFEVQAIARIDRMGQTRPTEVYCYYAEETVERNILDLAARQGQSLYTEDNSAGTLNTSPLGLESKKTVDSPTKKKVQKGDFVFKTDDMLAIFFPHLYEDLEYLLPPEEIGLIPTQSESMIPRPSSQTGSENAVAGPSRLR
ncbi:SNF2 family N-terminal domain-containing protein [Abortiporus biennis]|nr:SNF2 family N-terminal domain-containing protein [Abortiporus biennis]